MNLSDQNNILYTANFEICPALGLITLDDKRIRLGPVNMKVLQVLLENHGQVVSRAEIFEKVWKNQVVSDDTLTRCISDLRAQFGKHATELKLIETIPKRGYRWLAEVSERQKEGHLQDVRQSVQLDLAKTKIKLTPKWISEDDPIKPSKARKQWKIVVMWIVSAAAILLLLSTSTLWMVNRMVDSDTVRVALLPMHVENKQQQSVAINFEDLLKEQLLATENIRFLSSRTVEGTRQNLYPYLSREFAAEWIIEGRVRGDRKALKVTLNLVDARTALVSQSFTKNYVQDQMTLNSIVALFVKELEESLNRD